MADQTYHQSIVAMFANRDDAEAARRDLIAAGVPDGDITMHAAGDRASASNEIQPTSSDVTRAERHEGGFMDWLFGGDYDETTSRHRAAYEESVNQRNHILVAVKAIDTEAEYQRIAALLDRHNPININEGEYAQRFGDYQHTWDRSDTAATGAMPGAPLASQTIGDAPREPVGERVRDASHDAKEDMRAPGTTGERLRDAAHDAKQDLTGRQDMSGTGAPPHTDRTGEVEEEVIPVVKEEINISKRQVHHAKAYRIRTRVVETPIERQVTLHDETVTVDRRPASGDVPPGSEPFEERVVEVHEMREEPVVEKIAHLKEEVVVSKTGRDRVETVRDTVRETHVDVDRAAAGEKPTIATEPSTKTDPTTREGGKTSPRRPK